MVIHTKRKKKAHSQSLDQTEETWDMHSLVRKKGDAGR